MHFCSGLSHSFLKWWTNYSTIPDIQVSTGFLVIVLITNSTLGHNYLPLSILLHRISPGKTPVKELTPSLVVHPDKIRVTCLPYTLSPSRNLDIVSNSIETQTKYFEVSPFPWNWIHVLTWYHLEQQLHRLPRSFSFLSHSYRCRRPSIFHYHSRRWRSGEISPWSPHDMDWRLQRGRRRGKQ